jgi:mannitol-specific phosphotransferase system IIBC component
MNSSDSFNTRSGENMVSNNLESTSTAFLLSMNAFNAVAPLISEANSFA